MKTMRFLAGPLLILLTILAFWPMFRNGFVWDDQQFIVGNPVLRSLWPVSRFFQPQGTVAEGVIYPMTGQRPIMAFTLALDYRFWRLNPFGYHLTNLLLHLLCVIGVTMLARKLCRDSRVGFLVGVLFALHPGHAEGVIAFLGRSDLLATLFVIAGFGAYLSQAEAKGWRKALWYAASLASFAVACLSKESGLALLGILLVFEGWVLDRSRRQWFKRGLRLSPFLLIALLYWLYRGKVLGGQAAGTEWWGGSLSNNFLMMFEVYARYLRLLFYPLKLSPLHTVLIPRTPWDPLVLWGALLLMATFVLTFLALFRRPVVGFWASWFLLGLLPVANFIPIPGMILAERWLYLPSVGACVLAAWGAWALQRRAQGRTREAWALLVALAIMLFGVCTFRWCATWRTEESVARAIVATSPDSHIGRNNLGSVLLDQGKTEEAEIQLRESIRAKPDYFLAHNNLGIALRKQGRYAEAEAEFLAALRFKPDYAEAHSNLAVVLGKRGLLQGAVGEFRQAIRLKPNLADIHYNLGLALGRLGQISEAEEALREALRLDPAFADAHFNLGLALEDQGRLGEAVSEYRLYVVYAPQAPDRGMVEAKIRSLEEGRGGGPKEK
jgi:tetratricopeptide (TPR) repeat protein